MCTLTEKEYNGGEPIFVRVVFCPAYVVVHKISNEQELNWGSYMNGGIGRSRDNNFTRKLDPGDPNPEKVAF